jgi:uncharacterized protein (DUF736 family)
MAYDNTNKGVVFKNDKKGNEKAPDYKGTIDIEGKEFEIALWVRTSQKDGSKFFSTSQQPKQPKQVTPESVARSMPQTNDEPPV